MKHGNIGNIGWTVAVIVALAWKVPSAEAGFWSKLGKVVARYGDDVGKHADDLARHGDDVLKHADDVAKHGDDVAKHADDASKMAAGSADEAGKAAGRGADDVAEGGVRTAGKAAEKGGKVPGPGTILATGAAVGLAAAGAGEGVGRALEGTGKGEAHKIAAEKDPGQYAKEAYGPWRAFAEGIGRGMIFLLAALGLLMVALAMKIAIGLMSVRRRSKDGGKRAHPSGVAKEGGP